MKSASCGQNTRDGERGYTLIAVLALMTLMALCMTAAAPDVVHQAQRARELEAMARGDEVAEAIRLYAHYRNGALPTSMNDLLEGVPVGTKKIHLLRRSAARDPLSESGEWRLIGTTHPAIYDFQQAVKSYAGGVTPHTHDPLFRRYAERYDVLPVNRGQVSGDDTSSSVGPFIGVASRSTRKSVRTFYGIERHNQWVFTPLFR